MDGLAMSMERCIEKNNPSYRSLHKDLLGIRTIIVPVLGNEQTIVSDPYHTSTDIGMKRIIVLSSNW
jgi:hypothetical protein